MKSQLRRVREALRMSIRDYVKAKPTIKLPNPEGSLKVDIRPSTIRAVNEKLFPTIESGL